MCVNSQGFYASTADSSSATSTATVVPPMDYICQACHEGYKMDEMTGLCQSTNKTEEVVEVTYMDCVEAPTDVPMSDYHLNLEGCAICAMRMNDTYSWCSHCLPGYMQLLGGCFTRDMGVDTPNDVICENCAECRRFDGFLPGMSEHRCMEC